MYGKSNKGVIRILDVGPDEITITESEYPSYVAEKIHEKYSVDDEIAIIRQKEEKPSEYAEYYAYCESVKEEARKLIKEE